MFDNFNRVWQEFLEQGTIDEQEYQAMTLPQYYNTVEELSQPFADTKNEVVKSGLQLEKIETAVVPCPFAEDFNKHGDANKFAREYIPTIRSWNESIYSGALSVDRPEAQRHEIIEAYYAEYQSQVAADPGRHGMEYVHAYMTIVKG